MQHPEILIADDHPATRSGIKYILKSYFPYARIQETDNGEQAITICKQNPVDLLLMDLNMPDTDPQRTVQTLLALFPALHILILTMNKEEIFGPFYLHMGVKGFISKLNDEQEIVKAVKVVLSGQVYINKKMAEFYSLNTRLDDPYAVLTKKEKEVLRQLLKGDSIIHICQTMNIGPTTISTHKANIFAKLNVRNLIELKALADLYPL